MGSLQVYLKIANRESTDELYDRAFGKLLNKETDEVVKEFVLDLIRALLPYQSKDVVKKLYDEIVKKISNFKNHKEQKKYYR